MALTNETYMGDKLLQKTYSIDFLHKQRLINTGQVQQYYVEGDHEAIIPPRTFQLVREEIARRRLRPKTGTTIFSGRILCGECGQFYGPKVWHSTSKKGRRIVWQCNGKYHCNHPRSGEARGTAEPEAERSGGDCLKTCSHGRLCNSPTLDEADMKEAFALLLQRLDDIAPDCAQNLEELAQIVNENRRTMEHRLPPRERDEQALAAVFSLRERQAKLRDVLSGWKHNPAVGYSDELWCSLVDQAAVYGDKYLFILSSGEEVSVPRTP